MFWNTVVRFGLHIHWNISMLLEMFINVTSREGFLILKCMITKLDCLFSIWNLLKRGELRKILKCITKLLTVLYLSINIYFLSFQPIWSLGVTIVDWVCLLDQVVFWISFLIELLIFWIHSPLKLWIHHPLVCSLLGWTILILVAIW